MQEKRLPWWFLPLHSHTSQTVVSGLLGGLRLPLCIPSVTVIPDSSPLRLFLHSQPWSCLHVWSLKFELEHVAPTHNRERTSQAGRHWALALAIWVDFFPFRLLQTSCWTLLWEIKGPPLSWLISHQCEDFSGHRNISTFTTPFQGCKSHPDSFLSFFFPLSYPVMWRFSCFF